MKLLGIAESHILQPKIDTAVKKALCFAEISSRTNTELIRLQDYALPFNAGNEADEEGRDFQILIDKIIQAEALIIGSPIYYGLVSSSIEKLFQLMPKEALKGKVVGFVATSNTAFDHGVIDSQLKPLADYFQAHLAPVQVFVRYEHYENGYLTNIQLIENLRELGESIVNLHDVLNVKPKVYAEGSS